MKIVLDDDEVAACPDCGAAAVQSRGSDFTSEQSREQYRCGRCTASFDTFDVRERRGHDGLSGMARRLLEADPDDVRDGESRDGNGGVRPVPPGVASDPGVRDD